MTKKRHNNSWISEALEITANSEYSNCTRRELVQLIIPQMFCVTDIPSNLYRNSGFSITVARALQCLMRHDEALHVYQRVVAVNNSQMLCTTLVSMGRCLQEMGRYQEAMDCFLKGKEYGYEMADTSLTYLHELMLRKGLILDSQKPVDEQQDVDAIPYMMNYGFFAENPSHDVAKYPDEPNLAVRDTKYRNEPYEADFPWIVYPDLSESSQGPK